MAANQFGIDVGQIVNTRNAFADQQQRQQINALALQKGQMDLEQAPALNALNLKSKQLEVSGQEQSQQIARHVYQTQQTVDALGALDAVPDEQLPQATSAVIAKLKSDGIDGADQLGQALTSAGSDPAQLRAAVKQQLAAGMSYKDQLAQKNSDRTFNAGREDAAATAAYRAAQSANQTPEAKAKAAKLIAEAELPSKLSLEKTKADAANPFSAVAPPGAVGPNGQVAPPRPTGDEFLQTLPPQLQGQVKMLAEGKLAVPSGQALRTPYWQQLLQAANQYDPSLDQASAPARFKTRAAFSAGGKEALTINNLNTAIGHAGTLLDQIGGTFSGPSPTLNAVGNFLSEQTGHKGVPLFKDTAGKLAQELTAVYRNSGGAEKDVVRALQSMSENASDDQKRAVLGNAVDLLQSKMDALADEYNRGMGTTKDPLTLLNSHAKATFQKLRGGGQTAQAAQPQADPQAIVDELRKRGVIK